MYLIYPIYTLIWALWMFSISRRMMKTDRNMSEIQYIVWYFKTGAFVDFVM
jgi:hypothetical protein